MADIPLRTYVEQLDNLIERKQVDEVVAHCRHILGVYPKHLDTYRMLGKALLEKGRHGDAADIFQRVLSVMPDDFISHVGMAIVREDEANLEAAIWHMERAFEAAPANGAIQQELCRLYGRRDGVVPPKARLTRGALARMYAQGGLYLQAEAELKAALAADADRIDLMTKLADVYWQTDQPAQAAQASAAVIQKLPYSIDANRILVGVFRAQGRPNDAAVYRQRLEALDPYEAFADPAANGAGSAQVDPAKVIVARLDYVPGMEDTGSPDWLASIGAKFEEPSAARVPEAQPDWLSAASEAAGAAPAAEYQPGQGSVPDWLKELEASSTEAQPAASSDWLKEVQAATAPTGAAPAGSDEGLPDWLATATGPLPADAVPDWMLQSAASEAPSGADVTTAPLSMPGEAATQAEETGTVPTPASADGPAGELPDWLKTTVADEAEEDLPDWLKAITAQPMPAVEAPTAPAAFPADEIPDWLRAAAPDTTQAPTVTPAVPTEAAPTPVAMATTAAAVPIAAVTEPAQPVEPAIPTAETPTPEESPDWTKGVALAVESLAATAPAAPIAAVEPLAAVAPAEVATPEPVQEKPAEVKAISPAEAAVEPKAAAEAPAAGELPQRAPEPATSAELPDWLQAATAHPAQEETAAWLQTAPASPSLVAAPASAEAELELPDWLKEVAAGAPPADATAPAVAATQPPGPPEGAPPAKPPIELPDYLQLASPEAIARAQQPMELEPEPETEAEETEANAVPAVIPDWLKALAPSPDATVPAAEPPGAVAAEAPAAAETGDSLSWMDELTAGAASTETAAAGEPASEEVPAWLAAPEATAPESPGAVPGGLGQDTLAAEIPPWAQGEEPGPSDTIVSWLAGKHVPDWLRQPANEEPGLPAVEWEPGAPSAPAEPAAADSVAAAASADVAAQPAPAAPAEPAAAGAPGLEAMDADEAFRWLESLAAQQGARSEELFTISESTGAAAEAAPAVEKAEAPPEVAAPVEAAPVAAIEPATEPIASDVEPPILAAATPAPTEAALAEQGGLEEYLRQTEAAMPAEHLAGTAPSKKAEPSPAEAPITSEAAPPAAAAEQPAAPGEFDEDAALRWLEGLAAQQGAKPEELLTAPEERTLEAPQWVAEEKAAAEQAAAQAAPAEAAAEVPAAAAVTEPTPTVEAVQAPSAVAPVELAPAPGEPAAAPVEPVATISAAVEAPTQPEAAAQPEPVAAPEPPEWLKALAPSEAPAEVAPPQPVAADAEAPAEPEPAAAPAPPEWLKAYVPTEEPAEAPQPAPPAAEPEAPTQPTVPAEPAAPLTPMATADLDKLSRLAERLAAARRAREEEMEAKFAEQRSQQEAARRWVEERLEGKRPEPGAPTGTGRLPALPSSVEAPAQATVEPAAPAEAPTPELAAPAPTMVRHRLPRPSIRVRRPRPAPMSAGAAPSPAVVTPLAAAPPPAEANEALARGQAALSGQDYDAAVAHFSGLVADGHHLNSVVKSLEVAASSGSAPVPVLRLLGDAYVRADQLQQALDVYRQALSRL